MYSSTTALNEAWVKRQVPSSIGLLLLIALCFTVATGFLAHLTSKTLLEKEVHRLSSVAASHVDTINILLSQYSDRSGQLTTHPQFDRLLATNTTSPKPGQLNALSNVLQNAVDSDTEIAAIVVTDSDNRVIASTDREWLVAGKGQTGIASSEAASSGPLISTLRTLDQVYLLVTTPILRDSEVTGLLTAFVIPQAIQRSVESAQIGISGEILLSQRGANGNHFLLTATRNNRDAMGMEVINPIGPDPLRAELFGDNNEYVFENVSDYAGIPVLAVTRQIDRTGWSLVAKLDRNEVYAEIRNVQVIIILAALLLFMAVGLVIRASRKKAQAARIELQTDMELRLQLSHAGFREVLEAASSSMMIVNREGQIVQVNDKCAQLFGYTAAELLRLPVEDLMPEDMRDTHENYRIEFSRNPATRMINKGANLQALRKDGKIITVAIDLRPINTEQGTSVVVTIDDRTAALKAQKNIEEHAAALMRSNDALDQFAYVASHDLKAPLRGIEQLAAIIEEDCEKLLPQESRNDLQLLRSRAARMEQLLDNLLQYSRVGSSEAECMPIDLHELLTDLAQLYLPSERFRLEIKGLLPEVQASRTALEIVFRNLMMNSVKHHDRDHGKMTIHAELTDSMVSVTVLDDGPGLPRDVDDQAFALFRSVKRHASMEAGGMGLPLVRKTMQSLNGSIEIVRRNGRGCCFRLQWPLPQQTQSVELTLVAGHGS